MMQVLERDLAVSPEPTQRTQLPSPDGTPTALGLDPLELAAGMPLDPNTPAPPLQRGDGLTARVALEREVLAALSRPPCLINFSGGRDSSAMLALATTLARREGLPEPIALTWRFPAHPSTHEAGWQERVVEHLALSEWERLEFDEELDVLGEIATGVLRSHGLLWPATAHLNLAALARARGGTVIFCADMREVFDGWGFARAQAVLRGRVRPEPRDLRRIAVSLVPRRARRRIGAAESARHHAWLRPKAQRELFERSGGRFGVPRRWDRWVAWFAEERAVRLAKQSLEILARDHDVVASHPMSSPSVLSALADEGGAAGFGERPELTRHLFGDLVPKDLLMRRPTRGEFGTALWASRSRAFAATWDGTGVDPRLVDRDRLRAIWTGPHPWQYAATVAQAAWLATATATC